MGLLDGRRGCGDAHGSHPVLAVQGGRLTKGDSDAGGLHVGSPTARGAGGSYLPPLPVSVLASKSTYLQLLPGVPALVCNVTVNL